MTRALERGVVAELAVDGRATRRLGDLMTLASRKGIPVRVVERAALDAAAQGGRHQGVVARLTGAVAREVALEELVAGASEAALLVVLDGIEDPQNLGAIARAAEAAGADGLIRQSRHAAPLGGAAMKASAGALADLPIATVVNLARALESLSAFGVWTVGLAADAPQPYDSVDLVLPTAIVVGAEGSGLRRLVRERCEVLAAIPLHGRVGSLNASVAAGVVLFEARRQRRAAVSSSTSGSRPDSRA